jgi:hypothetical protein
VFNIGSCGYIYFSNNLIRVEQIDKKYVFVGSIFREIMSIRNLHSIRFILVIVLFIIFPNVNASDVFFAYYTKLPGNFEILEDYQEALFGKYSDLVIQIGKEGKILFSRNTSYLPVWQTKKDRTNFPEIIPRKGDGPAYRPDILSKNSHVRLLEQSKDSIVVHWRYFPEMQKVEWDDVVEEYFVITPDLRIVRSIQRGKPQIDDWKNRKDLIIQTLQLSGDSIIVVSKKSGEKHSTPTPISDFTKEVKNQQASLISWIDFDVPSGSKSRIVKDLISGSEHQVSGSKVLWKKGVSGTALQLDGYYSGITLSGLSLPEKQKELTISGWIALRAYPFDWAPLVHQSEWGKNGFYLGVDRNGYPGFHCRDNDQWISLIDSTQLKLFHWYHIGAVIKNDGEVILYVNGENKKSVERKSPFIPASSHPIMIGLNGEKMPAIEGRIRRGKWPSLFGVDGLVDDVKILSAARTEKQISAEFNMIPKNDLKIGDPDILKRELPVNPEKEKAQKFQARYTTLDYYDTWDNLWRIGDFADIVIDFDLLPVNLVFWRGTSYGPYFVTENGKWIGDQSNEDYRLLEHPGEAEGCLEHMSDKQCRHSHVRIIENTDARIKIHWRYGLVDSRYLFSPRNDGWGSWSDEYWTIYPDGVAIRHLARGKVFGDGWVETMFLSAPGTKPEENTELAAISLINDEGQEKTLTWGQNSPKGVFPNTMITRVNTKSQYWMYNIYPPESSVEVFGGRGRRSPFHWWNHWPVSQITSDGRGARAADRLAHSSLLWGNPSGDFLLYGITNKKPAQLISLAKSWNNPPELANMNGIKSYTYIQEERAYYIQAGLSEISFTVNASMESPLLNPAFIIKNWNDAEVSLKIDGKEISAGKQFRYGMNYDTSGKKYMIIWVELEKDNPIGVTIKNN